MLTTSKKEESVKEDSEFGVTGKPHPLLIPSIAFNILQCMSYSELKILRCVCNQWEYEACRLLQSKTQIRLEDERKVKQYLKELPVVNYSCVSFEFGTETYIKSPAMKEFFSNYGQEVKILKLHNAAWSNWQLWEVISELLPNLQELSLRISIPKYGHLFPDPEEKPVLPNIKKLNLSFSVERRDIYFTNPTILKELLSALPNLEALSCPNWPTIILPSTNVSTLVFNVILSDPEIKLKDLSYLLITANLSNTELYALINKRFPLKELRLELSPSVRGIYFSCLLMSIDDTLETLSLTFPNYYDVSQFENFPQLRKLKLLYLHKFQGSLENIVKNCPALKKLVLNEVTLQEVLWEYNQSRPEDLNENEIQNKDIENFQSPHMLEELIIPDKNDGPIGHIKVLVKLFPNLKRLNVQSVNDIVLRTVFTKLPQLEEFTAQGDFTDSGVTGFSRETCKLLMREDETISSEEAGQLRDYHYVGSLQKLKRLILESNSMTYLSLVYGVQQCKGLEVKRITSCNTYNAYRF